MKGICFDLDGTLIDSMGVWEGLDRRYVESKGHVYDPSVTESLKAVSFEKAPIVFNEYYDMGATYKDMIDFMYSTLEVYYREKFLLKDGAMEKFEELRSKGFRLSITTATDSMLTDLLVNRYQLNDYMDFVLTPDRAGIEKNNPGFFRMALEKLGTEADRTYVVDDALYALELAKDLGMQPIGIFDATSHRDADRIKEISKLYILDFHQLDVHKLI